MIRTFCDACGKEAGLTEFRYHNHIGHTNTGSCYAFADGTPWNGRIDSAHVCIPCYNQILGAAYREFTGIKSGCGVTRCHECGEEHGPGERPGCSR